MLRKPQHQTKCYCNNGFGCCNAITNARQPLRATSSATAASSSRAGGSGQRKTRVPFVKIVRQHSCAATKGLGHSHCPNSREFSRRHSLATTVETAPSNPKLDDEKLQRYAGYTERRRNYESLKDIALRNDQLILDEQVKHDSRKQWQQKQQLHRQQPESDTLRNDEEEFRLIVDLQKFRLNNPLDCFSDDHLYALRLQQQLEGLDRSGSSWATPANQAGHTFTITVRPFEAISRQGEHKATADVEHPALANRQLTPYAVRQKLLQLRLLEEAESEASRSQRLRRRQQIAPVQKSCALSYQAR